MKTSVITTSCVACALLFVPACAGEPKDDKQPAQDNKQPAHEISLEVQALRAVHALKLTDEQLKLAVRFTKETAEPERKRATRKVSDAYRKALLDLHDALLAADDDKIDNLEEEFEKLIDKDKPDLDDTYEITKGARKRTPEFIKSLTVRQLADFYSASVDDVKEPVALMMEALDKYRGLDKKEWTDKRDDIAVDVAWAVAGLDETKADKARDKAVALLDKGHSLRNNEFKTKKAALEKEAKTFAGDVGPDALLRHYAEHTVADMLSNPRLEAAVKARMK